MWAAPQLPDAQSHSAFCYLPVACSALGQEQQVPEWRQERQEPAGKRVVFSSRWVPSEI